MQRKMNPNGRLEMWQGRLREQVKDILNAKRALSPALQCPSSAPRLSTMSWT